MGLNKIARKAHNKLRPAARIVNKVVDRAPAVLGKTSAVLSKVGNISGKVLENPVTAAIVAAIACKSAFVAATSRTLTSFSSLAPSRVILRSSSTRSSLICVSTG